MPPLSGIISNRNFTLWTRVLPYWPFKCFLSMASSFSLTFALGSPCYFSGLGFSLKLYIRSLLHQVSVQVWPTQRGLTNLPYQKCHSANASQHIFHNLTVLYSIYRSFQYQKLSYLQNLFTLSFTSPSGEHKFCEDWDLICLFAIIYSKTGFLRTLN